MRPANSFLQNIIPKSPPRITIHIVSSGSDGFEVVIEQLSSNRFNNGSNVFFELTILIAVLSLQRYIIIEF